MTSCFNNSTKEIASLNAAPGPHQPQHHHLYCHPQKACHRRLQQSYPNWTCRHSLEISSSEHLFRILPRSSSQQRKTSREPKAAISQSSRL